MARVIHWKFGQLFEQCKRHPYYEFHIRIVMFVSAIVACVFVYKQIKQVARLGSNVETMAMACATSCCTCNVYDLSSQNTTEYKCVDTPLTPTIRAPICMSIRVRDKRAETLIKTLRLEGSKLFTETARLLKQHPQLGLIDVGAYLGVYSIMAARMFRTVLAVEPDPENTPRFHKAVQLTRTARRVTLLQNAMSDNRRIVVDMPVQKCDVTIMANGIQSCDNPVIKEPVRTITFDDLVQFCDFKSGILKINLDSLDGNVFSRADRLFQTMDIRYVIVLWHSLLEHLTSNVTRDSVMVDNMFSFLHSRHYYPHNSGNAQKDGIIFYGGTNLRVAVGNVTVTSRTTT